MIRATVLQDSFNRGELSPRVFMRVDAEFHLDGLKTMQNFVPVSRGASRRRYGFRYLGQVGTQNISVNTFPQTVSLSITVPNQTSPYVLSASVDIT